MTESAGTAIDVRGFSGHSVAGWVAGSRNVFFILFSSCFRSRFLCIFHDFGSPLASIFEFLAIILPYFYEA